MKSKYSITAFILIGIISISIRIDYAQKEAQQKQFCLTTYNAFGYYMYLPSALIYQDMRQLTWLPTIDRQYSVTGGSLYQAIKEKNGHHVFKYLGGVAIMQLPFFSIGHVILALI